MPTAPKGTNSATDASDALAFTVIGSVPDYAEDITPVHALLDAIDTKHPAFVVHLDSLKNCDEACSDTLLETRRNLFDSLIAPVIYIPDDHDWSDCQRPTTDSFDPAERLLRLHELFYPDDSTFGQRTMTVMRRSDQAKFRNYRENARWAMDDVLFVTLSVPGDNNNYKTAGGCNGGCKDRLEANRRWLAHAFAVAHQCKMASVVVIMQADSLFGDGWERRHTPNLFDGLLRRRSYDSCPALERQMWSLTRDYDGAVLLIHGANQTFMLDRPLKDEDDRPDAHIIHIRTYGSPVLDRWFEVSITPGRMSLFHICSRCLDNTPTPTPGITPTPAQWKTGAEAPVLVSQ